MASEAETEKEGPPVSTVEEILIVGGSFQYMVLSWTD